MDWRGKIVSDKNVLAGKPTVKGTRLSVEFLLGLFANGWQEEDVLKNYPTLKMEDIQAARGAGGLAPSCPLPQRALDHCA